MMFSQIAFHAIMGLAFGRFGLWGPDQPFDPNNPINPWALGALTSVSAALSGFVTLQVFGQEQFVLGALGAGAGSIVLTRAARSFGVLGRKRLQ
jgi:hypothetical protein